MHLTLCVTLGKSLPLPESQVFHLLSYDEGIGFHTVFFFLATKLLEKTSSMGGRTTEVKSTGAKINQPGFKTPELLFWNYVTLGTTLTTFKILPPFPLL